MRATRVLYVEDDPALRGIVASLLQARDELDLVLVAGSPAALIDVPVPRADVALLDLVLGSAHLTGIELGLLLREKQPDLGIVILTQHVVPDILAGLPADQRMGWSFLEKRADLSIDGLVETLRATARGLNVVDPAVARSRSAQRPNAVDQLSGRQRELMALLASGLEATAIADMLGTSATSVRKELSRAYAVLVPDVKPGTDVRTVAVLRYIRESRTDEQTR